jgi:hypothetical protein
VAGGGSAALLPFIGQDGDVCLGEGRHFTVEADACPCWPSRTSTGIRAHASGQETHSERGTLAYAATIFCLSRLRGPEDDADGTALLVGLRREGILSHIF